MDAGRKGVCEGLKNDLLVLLFIFLFYTLGPSVCLCSAGHRAGSSGLSSGAVKMCLPTRARVDSHSVSVCCAGGLWYGLSGTEKVHSQRPSCQVCTKRI